MIDIDDAIQATALVSPAKLKLGEGTAAQTKTLSITNNGSAAVTYTLSHDRALGTSNNTFAPGAVVNPAGVSFSPGSIEVGPGETETVDVTITPPALATNNRRIYSGYVRLTPSAGGAPLRVPYAGFVGDYQSIVALAGGGCSFPGIFKAGGETTCAAGPPAVTLPGWTKQDAGVTYNVSEREDRPVLLFHLAHPAQRVELRAVNASGDEFVVAFTNLAERNPTNDRSATGFYVYTWDGKAVFTNANGNVNRRALADGTYTLRVVVTKALAEPGNAAHIETWNSPTMNIVGGS